MNNANEWISVALGRYCKIKTGKKDVNEGNPFGQFPFFTCSRDVTWSDEYSFDTEAILIAGNGEVGNLHYYNGKFEAYQRTYVLDGFSINIDYVYQYLKGNLLNSLEKEKVGTSIPYIKLSNLTEFKVHIPKGIEAQKKIAYILKTIDQAIEKTEALIHKYQQIKAGLMHDLFTRGVTADGKLRPPREQAPELYKETPIGWIPKEWKAKKLCDILKDSGGYLQTGPFGSQLHAHEYTHEGVPVVMPQDINDGKIDTVDIARILEKRAQILYRHRLKIGDIIIARRGELSRAAAITEIEKTWVCGTGCFLLRLGASKLDASFFSYAYRHDIVQRQVAGLAVGSTMPSLNNTVMNVLYFPYVGVNEQNRISKRLGIVEQQIDSLIEHRVKLLKQKAGLMRDLLTGKVPVKIDQEETAHV